MAIKVIKRGAIPGERVYNGRCTNCNSVLQWNASDGVVTAAAKGKPETYTVTCPVCNEEVSAH